VGRDSALNIGWRLLAEKQDADGRFALESTLVKQPCNFGAVGKPNKWVTFYAVGATMARGML